MHRRCETPSRRRVALDRPWTARRSIARPLIVNSPVNKAAILGASRRRFDYDRRLLSNRQIAALEPDEVTDEEHIRTTDWSIGYPAWNLLYYSIYCSILPER